MVLNQIAAIAVRTGVILVLAASAAATRSSMP